MHGLLEATSQEYVRSIYMRTASYSTFRNVGIVVNAEWSQTHCCLSKRLFRETLIKPFSTPPNMRPHGSLFLRQNLMYNQKPVTAKLQPDTPNPPPTTDTNPV